MATQAPLYFKEQQRLHHPAFFALLSVFPAVFVWAVVQQVVFHIPLSSHPISNAALIVFALCFGLCFPLLVWKSRLITMVRADGVYIRIFPLHWRWTVLRPGAIRGHSPLECGSPAEPRIRYGMIGKAYNTNDNRGVLITLEDGRRLLVGSFEPEALDQAITRAQRAAGYWDYTARRRIREHAGTRTALRIVGTDAERHVEAARGTGPLSGGPAGRGLRPGGQGREPQEAAYQRIS